MTNCFSLILPDLVFCEGKFYGFNDFYLCSSVSHETEQCHIFYTFLEPIVFILLDDSQRTKYESYPRTNYLPTP